MAEEVIELSIEETQALRAKLGLAPLRTGASNNTTNSNNNEDDDIAPSNNNGNDKELSLSIEETNRLRLKIGLAPLKTPSDDTQKKQGTSNTTAIHAPPTNATADKEARERIQDAIDKREGLERLKRLQRENERDQNGGGAEESALDFVAKLRLKSHDVVAATATSNDKGDAKTKRNKKKTLSKNPQLSIPDNDEGDESNNNNAQYTSADLSGIKVSHAASDFEIGTTTVLTLADKSILDIDPDSQKATGLLGGEGEEDMNELINVNMDNDSKALQNLKRKRQLELGVGRAGGYAGYDDDEFEELGGVGVNELVLGGGNGGGGGRGGVAAGRSKGFAIGQDGKAIITEDNNKNKSKSDLFTGFQGGAQTLESRHGNSKVASDFITEEEMQESDADRIEKERKRQMKALEKLRKKDKKKARKGKKKSKRVYEDDEDSDEGVADGAVADESNNGGGGSSLLESLEATAVQQDQGKKKRRRHGDDDANSMNADKTGQTKLSAKTETDGGDEEPTDEQLMKEKRSKFDRIMEKGKVRTERAFKAKVTAVADTTNTAEDDDDDAFLNAALAKARRLQKLKELSGAKSNAEKAVVKGEDAVVQAVEKMKQEEVAAAASKANVGGDETDGKNGITFEFDEMQEFTRALRAREDQARRAPERSRGIKGVAVTQTASAKKKDVSDAAAMDATEDIVEDVDMDELANEMTEEAIDDKDEEGGFGSTAGSAPVGRGMAGFLSLLKQTGEIKHSGREEMRGRAKDKRTYEDYDNLNLKEVVKIDQRNAQDKDIEFANREIKLEYRDDFGRLLTRKEAYRNMCYQFHGHGSSKKNQERRLKQIEREQEEGKLASRQVSEGGVGTLGALKQTQKATGKAFIIHKT